MNKKILLVNKERGQRWLEERINGSLWQGEMEFFSSAAEASEKGWKVDAVKIIFEGADGKERCPALPKTTLRFVP